MAAIRQFCVGSWANSLDGASRPDPGQLISKQCSVALEKGEKDPWYLATNQLSAQPTLRLYRRRMWIEEMYGDMKGHGFELEVSRLHHADRLSRLSLAVCLLYVWLIAIGEYVLKNNYDDEVDRTERHDLSIFRLGWDFLERRLALSDPLPDIFCPNFCLMSGS